MLKVTSIGLVVATLVALFVRPAAAQHPYPRRQKAPELPAGLEWVNTKKQLTLADLRGKFVLLDFWTYCCINCMHVLPELKKVENAYPNELVVIGVHSGKFEAEQEVNNIRAAVARYGIEHPVVNDPEYAAWKQFGVRAWPTLILIDPEGFAVWANSGESTAEAIEGVLKRGLRYYRTRGLLDTKPLELVQHPGPAKATPLGFPGKVLADEANGRLFIADSSHNRIVVATLEGKLLAVIGSGEEGRDDGDFSGARFNDPQGMALRGETLYVADTKNHLIRKVDLAGKRVTTIAGTGSQRREPVTPRRFGRPTRTELASPWALWVHADDLYIAMAGAHQIWRMGLDESGIGPYAGNAREDIVDGQLLPSRPYELGFSSFAQPSGLASDGEWLYVADSEGSSIRAVPLDPKAKVRTVVGTADLPGARLFTFGDVDGFPGQARLQHPLGVVYHRDRLYVADTYNNKIKTVDPRTGETRTLVGTGEPGSSDDPARFDEPAGITAAGDRLYVADTNNHAVRVIDLAKGKRVSTLSIAGLEPPPADVGEPPQARAQGPSRTR